MGLQRNAECEFQLGTNSNGYITQEQDVSLERLLRFSWIWEPITSQSSK